MNKSKNLERKGKKDMKKIFSILVISMSMFSCSFKNSSLLSCCELVKRYGDLEDKKISVTGTYVRTGLGESSIYDPSCKEDSSVWVEFSDHIFHNPENINVLKLKGMMKKSSPIYKKENPAVFTVPYMEAEVVFVGNLTQNKIFEVTDDSPLSDQIEAMEPRNMFKLVFTVSEIRIFKAKD